MLRGFLLALAVGFASLIVSVGSVHANPITYSETASATGSLGGVAFTDATIVLTMNGDTTNVSNLGTTYFENIGTVSLSINGSGPVTLSDTSSVFSNLNISPPYAGFGVNGLVLLAFQSAAFATYDLTTSIGPISGLAIINGGHAFSTSGGDFIIDSITGNATFTATTTSVPEPASLSLFAPALLGLVFFSRRKRFFASRS